MANIVYLIGAGASAAVIPVVCHLVNDISLMIILLEKPEFRLSAKERFKGVNITVPEYKYDLQQQLISDLKWLVKQAEDHASVDTLAKKFYIKRDWDSLNRLKLSLSAYFVLKQSEKKTDMRYDAFYASLIHSLNEFPGNIKIISWNYDYQFEQSYMNFAETNYEAVKFSLNINHKYGDNRKKNGFGIYKLNGTTGFYSEGGWNQKLFTTTIKSKFDKAFVEDVVYGYLTSKYNKKYTSGLSFAWEHEDESKGIVNLTIEATKNADVLIVIGYSFPFFNHEVDRKIINIMGRLKHVYFQTKNPEELQERFKAVYDNYDKLENTTLIKNCDSFILPNEL